MTKKDAWQLLLTALFMAVLLNLAHPASREEVNKVVGGLHWLGQGSAAFRIQWRGTTIFIDPKMLVKNEKADIVLVTHDHEDHLSLPDLRRIVTPQTVVLAPPSCRRALQVLKVKEIVEMRPGARRVFRNIPIVAVPAYNVKKSFHLKEQGGWGMSWIWPE